MATYRDFVYECDMYEYSNDNYQLQKYISEAQLMDRFLENQEYISTYSGYLTESGVHLEDGFFAESKSTEEIQVIEEKFGDTISKIFTAIRKGILRLINGLISLLQNKKAKLEAKISKADPNAFFGKKISKKVADALKIGGGVAAGAGAGIGIGLFLKRMMNGKSKVKAGEGVSQEEIIQVSEGMNVLQAAKEGRAITVSAPAGYLPSNGDTIVETVIETANSVANSGVAAQSALNGFDKKIEAAVAAAKGMYTSLNPANKSKLLEKAQAAQKLLNDKFNVLDGMDSDSGMGRSKNQEIEYNALKAVLPKLNKWVSNLINAENEIDRLVARIADNAVAAAQFLGEAEKSDAFGDTAGAEMNRQAAAQATQSKASAEKDLEAAKKARTTAATQTGKALKQAEKITNAQKAKEDEAKKAQASMG